MISNHKQVIIQMMRCNLYSILVAAVMVLTTTPATGTESENKPDSALHGNDTHYTKVGFFDIHVCNWPDRELFFMPLFATSKYSEITDIKIQYPDGKILTSLNLKQYKVYEPKNKPKKRVFISQVDVPDGATDGWYSAIITKADGTEIIAKDYVIISRLPRATEMNPANGDEDIPIPEKMTWSGTENGYFQVFIRDAWEESKLIYESKLLREPELTVPAGLLKPGGLYTWQIHSRDVNEDILLGDFNKGSMSRIATFSIADDQ